MSLTDRTASFELFASTSADCESIAMKKHKRVWWEELKSKIGTNLLPQRVARRTSVISPEGIRSAGQGTTNESAPAATISKKAKRRAEFYVGQRVRLTPNGISAFSRMKARAGVVARIHDLSHTIRVDDPNGTRNFAFDILADGNKSITPGGNAAYWEPEND